MVLKGVIFDMDGLIFDTEKLYYEETQKVADAMSFPYDLDLYLRFLGVSDAEMWEEYHVIYRDFGADKVREFIERGHEAIKDRFIAGDVQLKPGVLTMLDYLDDLGVNRVVASSNTRPVIEHLLDQAGIAHRFNEIVSAENVVRAKPDPQIFIEAMNIMASEPQTTLVLEDSLNGIKAGHAAGIPVFLVPDLLPPTAEMKAKADRIFTSLAEIPAYLG